MDEGGLAIRSARYLWRAMWGVRLRRLHFVCDMVKGMASMGKSRFRIVALGQNLPTMTAYSNDVSYADARWLRS